MENSGTSKTQKNGAACILIHGFTGTPWTFSELVPELKKNSFKVSVPLLPGHGTKPSDLQKVKWQEWYSTIHREYEKLKNSKHVFLVGHSVGGALALLIAARNDIAGVVSLSAPYKFSYPGIKLLPVIKPFVHCIKKHKNNFAGVKDAGYNCYPVKGISECMKMLKTLQREIHKVNCPVFFAHSRGDRRIKLKNMEKLLSGVSSSVKKSLVMENNYHMITKGQDRELLFKEVVSFIAEQTGSTGR